MTHQQLTLTESRQPLWKKAIKRLEPGYPTLKELREKHGLPTGPPRKGPSPYNPYTYDLLNQCADPTPCDTCRHHQALKDISRHD